MFILHALVLTRDGQGWPRKLQRRRPFHRGFAENPEPPFFPRWYRQPGAVPAGLGPTRMRAPPGCVSRAPGPRSRNCSQGPLRRFAVGEAHAPAGRMRRQRPSWLGPGLPWRPPRSVMRTRKSWMRGLFAPQVSRLLTVGLSVGCFHPGSVWGDAPQSGFMSLSSSLWWCLHRGIGTTGNGLHGPFSDCGACSGVY